MRRDSRFSTFGQIAGLTAAIALLAGCKSLGLDDRSDMPVPDAMAQLVDARGADRGRVDIFKDGGGLRLELVARGFDAGTYGMHVHTIGNCTAPGFSSAGPHWNPTNAQHGRDNPMGAHGGDLPNLTVEPNMIGRATLMLPGANLGGESALIDGDGAAFVIHAKPDDMKTDPSGNSGDRIACGVIMVPPVK